MSAKRTAQTLEQLRRILLLMAGGKRPAARRADLDTLQLELQFFDSGRSSSAVIEEEPRLEEANERLHSLALELVLLMQMEFSGLVVSPLAEGRKRLRLGSLPSLRLLEEWSGANEVDEAPWDAGRPAANREAAYRFGLGRIRVLATALDLSRRDLEEVVRRLHPLVSRATPEDDLPGLIHGHGLRHALVLSSRGRPAFRLDRERSRAAGVMYTPPELIGEIARTVLDPLAARGAEVGLSVCDPACGSGQFLLAAAERLAGWKCRAGSADPTGDGDGAERDLEERLARLTRVHGVDLDPRAARIAAHNLSLWAARLCGGLLEHGVAALGAALDRALGESYPYLLGTTIQVGDALSLESSAFSPSFLWERRFSGVFERDGFDVVLGNPPWISHGLRDREGASEEERAYYDRLFPAGAQYKLNLYPLFIELALRITRPGGHHGFLVPDSLLAGHHFSRIRERLLLQCELLELTLLESSPWPGASTGFTVFYAVRRRDGTTGAAPLVRNRILRAAKSDADTAPYVGLDHWVPAAQYSAGAGALRIFREKDEVEFQTRMLQSPLRLRDVLWSYSGLIARYGQKSVQADQALPELRLRDSRGREVLVDPEARTRWRPALLSGAEVLPYRVQWRGGYLYLPETRDQLPKVWKSGFDLKRYRGAKIFLRQTGDRLIAAIDHEGFYCLNNLHLLGSRDEVRIPPQILLGVLLSAPLQRLYRIFSPEVSRPLAQVDLKIVESLPYPVDGHGQAIGSVPAPARSLPQSRRALRLVDAAVKSGDVDGLLALLGAAHAAGRSALEGGPATGGEIISLVLIRLLELRHEVPESGGPKEGARPIGSELQDVLDASVGVLFGLGVPQTTFE